MAKKKSKKRRPPPRRPAPAAAAKATERSEQDERQPSKRAERKEEARRERERRIKAARRRQRNRRLARWGIALAVVGGVGGFVTWQVVQSGQEAQALDRLASSIGCPDGVQELPDEGQDHLQPADPDPTYGTVPAGSGPHDAVPLPAEPKVYSQPVPERTAVHNLEHGYILIYYRDGGLDQAVVDELTDLAEGETEVIMAPRPDLEEGTNLALMAWQRSLTCGAEDADPGDVREVAEAFIAEFKNETAPEAEVS